MNKKMIIRGYIRAVAAVFTAAVLFCGVFPAQAAAYSGGLDAEIAVGIIDDKTEAGEDTAQENKGPVLEAGSSVYAEALTQTYRTAPGKFELYEESRFYIITEEAEADEKVVETVKMMNSQFADYGIPVNVPLPIVYGTDEFTAEGDIVIRLADEDTFDPGCETADKTQSYRLDIEEGKAEITACSTDGIYYGLITLMEMAIEKRTEDLPIVIDGCSISDGPDLAERAVFLDCGRRYFKKEWIENFIKRSSLQKYNRIVLHFSEAEGLRLDSDRFPWLTDGIESLTREEVADIVALAKYYHMDVIPSFDVPGHNRYIVEAYAKHVKDDPDFSFEYGGKTYDKSVKGFGSIANYYSKNGETKKSNSIGIDLTSEHSVAFINALIDDYATFFRELGCTEFDICGDEVLGWDEAVIGGEQLTYETRWQFIEHWEKYAKKELGIEGGSPADTFITFINNTAERLEGMGYRCRVFNDDIDLNSDQHVELRENIDVVYWSGGGNSAKHFTEKGHTVHYGISKWCYYVTMKTADGDIMDGKYKTVNAENIFENWDPQSFASDPAKNKPVTEGKHGGGYFCIWCDQPEYKDDAAIWKETEMRTWANSSRLWNREVNSDASGIRGKVSYEHMKEFAQGMNGFPGYGGDPDAKTVSVPAEIPAPAATWWEEFVDDMGF